MQIKIDSLPEHVRTWLNSLKKDEPVVLTKQGQVIAHISMNNIQVEKDSKDSVKQEESKSLYELFASYEADCAADKDLIEIRKAN